LSGALLSAGLIDELVIYMAPKLMGSAARGLFDLPWLANMAQCVELEISDVRPVAHDWRITAAVKQR
jgi:diaminohydroxyphosphoribosylaminopyrimidine deaminase/5-amino-6-(5-phosphoribosylamino)uracil reductase